MEIPEITEERKARFVLITELAERYREIEEESVELQVKRDEFYRDVTRLRREFKPESLAALTGVTRDAVYKWFSNGRKLLKTEAFLENIAEDLR